MKIEEIKERLKNASGEYGWYVNHDTDITYEEPAGSCDEYQVCVISNVDDAQFVGNAKNDIRYLLSIIEQAENEFNKIYSLANGLNANEVIIRQKAEESLQVIRGK